MLQSTRFKNFLFALIPTLLLLAVLEVGSRLYEQQRASLPLDFDGGFLGQSPVAVPNPEKPGFMKTNPAKSLFFAPLDFSRVKAAGTFRVAFLGESSVMALQPLLPSLAAQIQAMLPGKFQDVEVLNFGAASYGSQRLLIVAQELLTYEPDLLLIYMGHNEFEEVEQFRLIAPGRASLLKLAHQSAFIRVATSLIVSYQISNLKKLSERPDTKASYQFAFTEKDLEERMNAFRANLESILSLSAMHGVPVVIGTVPSNLLKPILPLNYGNAYQPVVEAYQQGKYKEAFELGSAKLEKMAGRHQSSNRENAIIRASAGKFSVPVVEVEKAVIAAEPHHIPGETLFRDSCHLNKAGNEILIREFLRKLKELEILLHASA